MLESEAQAKQWKEAKLEVKFNYWKAMHLNYEVLNESLEEDFQVPFDDHSNDEDPNKPSSRSIDNFKSYLHSETQMKFSENKNFDEQSDEENDVQNIEFSKSEESKSDEYSGGNGDESY
jgi:hypothetical protein